MSNQATEQVVADDYGDLPPRLRDLLMKLPEYLDNRHLAEVVSAHLFIISDRTLETWPVPSRPINGRRQRRPSDVLRYAWGCINSAPEIMRDRQPTVVGVGRGRRRRAQASGPAPPLPCP